MKIIVDGRPIREPISGVADTVINLVLNAQNIPDIDLNIFLQSDVNKNKVINKFDFKNKIIENYPKLISNFLYEYGINLPLLNFNNSIIHETYFARIPVNRKNNKLISTIHDVIPLDFPNWFSKRNAYFSKKNFYRQMEESDVVIFPSKYTSQRSQDIFGKSIQNEIIPWAVSNKIRSKFNTYNPDIKNPFFLMIGNIEPRKNLPFAANLVNFFNKINSTNHKLIIAGKENFSSFDIKKECEKYNKNIIYLNFVSNDKKIDLLQKTACLIYPSKYEGFGLPIIEALVIGTPFLATNNSSLSEIIPKDILSYEEDNLESALDSLNNIIFRSQANILGESEYYDCCKNYDWKIVANKYAEIYKAI